MPAPSEIIEGVVDAAAEEEAEAQNRLAWRIAFLWFLSGGVDDEAQASWVEVAPPLYSASRTASAERARATTSLLWSLETDHDLELFVDQVDDLPAMQSLHERADRFIDAPVVRARYDLSQTADIVDAAPDPPSLIVQDAREQARATGVYTPVSPRYERAMDRGAARAVQQALGDSDRAYGIGAEAAAKGKKVKRWVKVPHARACERCVLVARRGYRSAETAKLAGHAGCRCTAKAEWVVQRGYGSRQGVRNVDWQDALEARGYGILDQFVDASEAGRRAILEELFPE